MSEALYSCSHLKEDLLQTIKKRRNQGQPPSAVSGSGSSARIRAFARRTSQRRDVIGLGLGLSPLSVRRSRNRWIRDRRNAAVARSPPRPVPCRGRRLLPVPPR